MPDPDDPNANPPSAGERREPAQPEGDVPNLGPTSDPSGRDFGDSAGYGSGGSARDYQEVVGENPVTAGRPNPFDEVIPSEPQGSEQQGGLMFTLEIGRRGLPIGELGRNPAEHPPQPWINLRAFTG